MQFGGRCDDTVEIEQDQIVPPRIDGGEPP